MRLRAGGLTVSRRRVRGMGRAPCCDKANVKKGPWSPEEDAKLKAYMVQHGTGGNWIALPQKIGLKRCGKSCRLRWLNYLRPNIKHGGFTEEEDNIICSLYTSIGSRWSVIAAQLPGRTDNDIKNYWNTKLKKKLLGRRKDTHMSYPEAVNQESKEVMSSAGFSTSALEQMQLTMQLQNPQNPFTFYNSRALRPMLQFLRERILASQDGDTKDATLMQHTPAKIESSQSMGFSDLNTSFDGTWQANYLNGDLKQDYRSISMNCFSSSTSPITHDESRDSIDRSLTCNINSHMENSMQSQLNDLPNNMTSSFMVQEEQRYGIGSIKETIDGNESVTLWGIDVDAQSWNTTSILQPDGMFQDYLMAFLTYNYT